MTTTPELLFDVEDLPPVGLPEAPTARLVLPSGDLDDPVFRGVWELERRKGIGGSEVAAILGLDKYRGPRRVYEEKHGYKQPDNRFMRFGRRMEPVIAAEFEDETGLKTAMPPGTLAHIEHDWARSNVDRFVLDAFGQVVAPLECKNKSEHAARQWEDEEEAPENAALQAHWNTAIGGWSHSYVAAVIGGNRLKVWRQERDEELIAELFAFCGDWYQRHIVEGLPPAVDGLKSTTELLARLWECKAEKITDIDLSVAVDLRTKRAALKDQIEELDDQLTTVENQMREHAGENGVVRADGKKAWSWVTNGNFASKRFREEQPELAAKYVHTVEELDLARLKAEQPKVYDRYRARVLRVPKKGL
ncbi:YqaJ viral recombinase family protein [Streptomyces hirsutus]|uniref:YqaJ viral recombinase family nuclease n=1 Tax=Streptomyces hirsutus TaxID=35620 RepID=UPI00363D00CF